MSSRNVKYLLILIAWVTVAGLAFLLYPREPGFSVLPEPLFGGTLRIGNIPPGSLDPIEISGAHESFVINQIHEGLVEYNVSLDVVPGLAERWDVSDNFRCFRFYLRKNIRFHSGDRVTAEDVVSSFQRLIRKDSIEPTVGHAMLQELTGAADFLGGRRDSVRGISILPDSSIEFRTDRPVPDFLMILSSDPYKIVGRSGDGAGPFRLVSQTPTHLQMVAFEDYHGGRPYLDSLIVYLDPVWDEEMSVESFDSGSVDIIDLPTWELERFQERSDVEVQRRQGLTLEFLGINNSHPVLSRPEVRWVMARSIDWTDIFAETGPLFRRATCLIPPGLAGYRERPDLFSREELYPPPSELFNGPAVEYIVVGVPGYEYEEDTIFMNAWRQLGLQVDYNPLPWEEWDSRIENRSAHLFSMAWVADLPSTPQFLYDLFHSEGWGNYFNYRNTRVDSIIELALWSVDQSERLRLATLAEEWILEDLPIIPLDYVSSAYAIRNGLMNVSLGPMGLGNIPCELIWWNR